MKTIIQRNLDLSKKYVLTDKKYIPLADGFGCVCDNCNKLIANIATIKNGTNTYNIGFDCLDTILLNNSILDGRSIEQYEHFKSHVKGYISKANELKDIIKDHNTTKINKIVSLEFDVTDFNDWLKFGNDKKIYLTYYFVFDNGKKYNSSFKIMSDSNLNDFFTTIKTITKINITII